MSMIDDTKLYHSQKQKYHSISCWIQSKGRIDDTTCHLDEMFFHFFERELKKKQLAMHEFKKMDVSFTLQLKNCFHVTPPPTYTHTLWEKVIHPSTSTTATGMAN